MRISLDWLSQYITWTEKDPHAIANVLTLRSAEVEGVEEQGTYLRDCCVGKILAVLPHPNAEKLRLADVNTDRGTKRVVCGGSNLYEGMLVAFAHIGATVKHGNDTMTLTEATIRGEKSNGMLCAAEELDLTDMFPAKPEDGGRPIIDLSRDASNVKSGQSLREALGLTDVVLDINNTAITNRPDLFSHLGFARECVAVGLAKWKPQEKVKPIKYPKAALPFTLKTPAKKTLSWYAGCAIDIDAQGETPDWMKRRLGAVGIRSISLPVDITNYVMLECGSPLHAFDRDDIRGDVELRVTTDGESIVTLDAVKRVLPTGTIVLSDDEGIFDIVGMMGGERSSMKDSTRRIFLHIPVPDPLLIRRTITGTGHRTDAATIFEKGVPPVSAEQGFNRAVELFLSLVPGATLVSSLSTFGSLGKAPVITLRLNRLEQVLGVPVTAATAKARLEALGFTVKKKGASDLTVTAPLWRLKDVSIEEDLIEDVARTGGYELVKDILPSANLLFPPLDTRTPLVRRSLAADSYYEILPLTLLGSALLKRTGMDASSVRKLQSPLSEELSILQPSTLPGLLEHAERSMAHVESCLKTFRIASVFSQTGEHRELGVLVTAKSSSGLLAEPALSLIDDLRHTFKELGYAMTVEPKQADGQWMHPGRTASVSITGKDGKATDIGTVAEVHPDICRSFGLPARAAAALVDWSLVLSLTPSPLRTSPVAVFPAITYDTTVARTMTEPVGALLAHLRTATPLLENVTVRDLYQSPKEQHYRLTLRCTYRAADRTLTEEEAKKAHDAVLIAGKLTPLA